MSVFKFSGGNLRGYLQRVSSRIPSWPGKERPKQGLGRERKCVKVYFNEGSEHP